MYNIYMCVYIYIYIHIYIHIHTYIYVYTHTHIYSHIHTHTYIYLWKASCVDMKDHVVPIGQTIRKSSNASIYKNQTCSEKVFTSWVLFMFNNCPQVRESGRRV